MPCCTERYKLSHIHDFTHERFFIDCSHRQTHSSFEHKDKHGFILGNISIINYNRNNDNVSAAAV